MLITLCILSFIFFETLVCLSISNVSSLRPTAFTLCEKDPVAFLLTSNERRDNEMKKAEQSYIRKFGKTGLEFYIFGSSSIWFGRRWPMNNDKYRFPDRSEIEKYLEIVFNNLTNKEGRVMLDVAAAYGLAEQILGEILQDNPDWYSRAFIATKWGEEFDIDTERSVLDHSKKRLVASVKRSIRRLGRIDLLYIHGTTLRVLRNENIMSQMQRMKSERYGGINYIGVSISKEGVLETAIKEELIRDFDVVQMPGQLFLKRNDLVKKLYQKGIAIVLNSVIRGSKINTSDSRTCESVYADFIKHKEVSVILLGTRNHLRETIAYILPHFIVVDKTIQASA